MVVQSNINKNGASKTAENNFAAVIGTGTATAFQTPHGGVEGVENRDLEDTGSEERLEELIHLI